MRKVKFLLSLISGITGLFLIGFAPYTLLVAESGINPQMIDSEIDKLFYLMMVVGCGLCYGMTSVFLLKNWKLTHKAVLYTGVVSVSIFFTGLYYHNILGSPW